MLIFFDIYLTDNSTETINVMFGLIPTIDICNYVLKVNVILATHFKKIGTRGIKVGEFWAVN